jgi:Zn-finger nucleic acid-binding protein
VRAVVCPFCGETTVPAPRTIERVVERLVVIAPEATGAEPAGPRCPRCAVALRAFQEGRSMLRGCRECGGIWMARVDVERLSRVHDPDVGNAARLALGVASLLSPRRDERPLVSCPECGEALRRERVPETRVEVDVCATHGTWFDRGEVSAFSEGHSRVRAGDIDEDDLRAAGIPGGTSDAEEGTFGGFFRNLFRLMG